MRCTCRWPNRSMLDWSPATCGSHLLPAIVLECKSSSTNDEKRNACLPSFATCVRSPPRRHASSWVRCARTFDLRMREAESDEDMDEPRIGDLLVEAGVVSRLDLE